jgi:putative glutathione S-transferase
VADTVNMAHIKRHYYGSHRHINPTGIVAVGPELDFGGPHDRARLPALTEEGVTALIQAS